MIRFSCAATGDVSMLDAHAELLLTLIGKEKGERGAIAVADMADAIARLQTAGARDRHALQAEAAAADDSTDEQSLHANQVGLSQRAFPLIEMLKRAQVANEPVLWGF